jgi:hypothetical protein
MVYKNLQHLLQYIFLQKQHFLVSLEYLANIIDLSCFKNSGNPAAVCLLEDDISDQLKQQIAAEMNISETAFLTTTAAGIHCQLAENSAALFKRGQLNLVGFVHKGPKTAEYFKSLF